MPHKPSWFRDNEVVISNAPTCGINKDGLQQFVVDAMTGERSESLIDNKLAQDVRYALTGKVGHGTLFVREAAKVWKSRVLVPSYFDESSSSAFTALVERLGPGFKGVSLADLKSQGLVRLRVGHGSPSADQRVGDVPYIKVSDLRAGQVNVNPSNRVPLALAMKYWKGANSKLEAYDLVSPSRASKNIGEFCVLLPGQEQVVITKEVLIARAAPKAPFDQFYLMWALSLQEVRDQWKRVVLMQTNREDVGSRALEVRIPVPDGKSPAAIKAAQGFALPFREHYQAIDAARAKLRNALGESKFKHHFFV